MNTIRRYLKGALVLLAVGFAADYITTTSAHEPARTPTSGETQPMAMHMAIPEMTRRIVAYKLPKVMLVREDGKHVSLPEELNDGRPVVLTFIFTSCREICPIISATFAQLQGELGQKRDHVHLVSISIDPEHDTPARLAAYAKKFGAGPEWHHYTGTFAASEKVQRAFDVYHGDKMSHTPVTFLRRAPGERWVRIDGFTTADELMHELRSMLAKR